MCAPHHPTEKRPISVFQGIYRDTLGVIRALCFTDSKSVPEKELSNPG